MTMREFQLWLTIRSRRGALGCLLFAVLALPVSGEVRQKSSRDFFNDGTAQFQTNKLREAESALQVAVTSQNERVQPAALYNLGHVRFQQGVEALKEAPDAKGAAARGDHASAVADSAIQAADAALASGEVDAITRAYLQGKGARKELKAAMEAVKKALEAHGAVLRRWERASGDFKSAYELQTSLESAKENGAIMDRHIAALVDKQEMMMKSAQCMGGKRKDLQKRMQDMKKKMPDGAQKDDEGEDEEDEEDQKEPKQPKSGDKEKETKEGRRMELTWDEAMRLLESLKLDANRKLPMGDRETANPKDRKRREW
ncbi:MAG: hypothetical protein HZA90_27640 [Verrucomicrobia bacterium]|nr:hypothetical protein [Verrucomicrobiota bacterium]